ncbi:DUF2827 family protein, partial [Burkholderia ubonensis]|uniref:DUF2827 family protein n=1 Tax=Burkholderia ubonensis TaxID=101571 RepID=UPI001E36F4EA
MGQNVLFLARLLRTWPGVDDVLLLNCGDQATMPVEFDAHGPFKLLSPRQATDHLDVVIEMAGGLEVAWLDYLRALGKRVVYFCVGQPYVSLIEPSVFQRSGYTARAQRCDAVWVLPKDRVFVPMLEALHRCPVVEV